MKSCAWIIGAILLAWYFLFRNTTPGTASSTSMFKTIFSGFNSPGLLTGGAASPQADATPLVKVQQGVLTSQTGTQNINMPGGSTVLVRDPYFSQSSAYQPDPTSAQIVY